MEKNGEDRKSKMENGKRKARAWRQLEITQTAAQATAPWPPPAFCSLLSDYTDYGEVGGAPHIR
jgi:hypothetical protein